MLRTVWNVYCRILYAAEQLCGAQKAYVVKAERHLSTYNTLLDMTGV